ncbi:MAG: NAD-dependent epimerase [Bacteroidota bacterium]
MSAKTILVTGAAGFIGYHLAQRLHQEGHHVIGIDNINDYYSTSLKQDRIDTLAQASRVQFRQMDLGDDEAIEALFEEYPFEVVINLAAQAGVRYSLKNPKAYTNSNLVGFANILEACRHHEIKHLLYASSSSVYGSNQKQPFSEHHSTQHPQSLYAATKKSNEMLAHSYAHLFGLPVTGLRFFTVYGPWGRPDMAYYKFAKMMMNEQPLPLYNGGDMYRDFTYIDDIVEAIVRLLDYQPQGDAQWEADNAHPDPATSAAPYRIFNIGRNQPVHLLKMVDLLEEYLGVEAIREDKPMPATEVYKTWADSSELYELIGFEPTVDLEEGLQKFVDWFTTYETTS